MNRIKPSILITFLLVTSIFGSCADDDSFTLSSSKLLTLSVDTINMDTVFSTVPTSTKTFWIYNRSGDGIRCSSVRLTRGNQSGFRVNVDGIYLGDANGFQTTDIEVRDGDSIRVFVELTSKRNGSDTPKLVEDNLLFSLESGVEQRVILQAHSWDADIYDNLIITEDQTIYTHRPMIINKGMTVAENVTLRIAAGSTLYFQSGAGIEVYGTLITEGSADKNVCLRGVRTDNMFDYLPYDLVSGQWKGITFHDTSFGNHLLFTDIHSAMDGVVCDSATSQVNKLTLEQSTIHNCQGDGLKSTAGKIILRNTQITNTLGDCLHIIGGDVEIQHCTLAQYYPFDADRGAALAFCNQANNPVSVRCYNSLITGYAEDQLMGERNDEGAAFDYLFDTSILRTPVVEDTAHFKAIIWEDPKDTVAVGEKHFVLVDGDTQHYDYHLSESSPAIGKANPLYALPIDREGRERKKDAACIGAYEYIKP
ncbi:MAG: right-handed parallel beta-helix repeat-containing protein [Prevotella sp.]|nr:right-handed parallel beta-helix repeat-containing protein [Prevotella sp.]